MRDFYAFNADHVCRLSGLSQRQLAYWDTTGFFSPAYAEQDRRLPFSRVYSFQDIVGLRTIATLRKSFDVSLQELRHVARWLKEHPADSWANLTLYVVGRRVYFDDADSGARLAARPDGQTVLPVHMEPIVRAARVDVERLRERTAEMVGQIERHRYVAHNAPVLAGTRVPASAVWNLAQAGYNTAAIIREYPRLRPADIEAALAFECARRERTA